MIQNEPLVSIIIPAYNAHRYIERSLKSVLSQTYGNMEIIVIDDGSKDDTADLVSAFKDPRIRLIRQQNQGQGAARNNGIKSSRGVYVTFLDSDDLYLPEKVEKQVKELEHRKEYDAVYSESMHFYSSNPSVILQKQTSNHPTGDITRALFWTSLINLNTVMMRSTVFANGIRFPEGREGRYSEEWDLWIKMSHSGVRFGFINESLVIVEIRDDSNTQWDKQWIIKKNTVDAFQKYQSEVKPADPGVQKELKQAIRSHKKKLAISYLVAENKSDFRKTVVDLYGPVAGFLSFVLLAPMPKRLLARVFMKVWISRQKSYFADVPENQVPRSTRELIIPKP